VSNDYNTQIIEVFRGNARTRRRSMLGSAPEADDAVQEVVIRLSRSDNLGGG
jgi:DNA-directed RNA polymerase specialized sigma24 family protein